MKPNRPYWEYPYTDTGFIGSTNGRIAVEFDINHDIPDGAGLYVVDGDVWGSSPIATRQNGEWV